MIESENPGALTPDSITGSASDALLILDNEAGRDSTPVIETTAVHAAVLMPNWLSEFIIALWVVTRKAEDQAFKFTLIVPERFVALCRAISPLPVIQYSRKNNLQFFDSAARVKDAKFEKIFLLPHSFSSALFAFKTGIPNCRGINAEQRNKFLTESISSEIITFKEHLSREYSVVMDVPYTDVSTWSGSAIDPQPNYAGSVVLCTGAGEPTKRWQGFEELVKLWSDQHFVLLGDDDDVESAKNVGRMLPHRVVNLTGRTTLDEAAAIIAGASVVIANDSGLMQLAGFLGTPVVAIFGGSSPLWRRPLGPNARIVKSSDADCRFCFKKECAKKDFRCLTSILPVDIIGAAMEIMRKQGTND